MKIALGMVELNSIARGIETCDYMIKAAQVELLRASTVCPGKYIVLVSGDTGAVKVSVEEGLRCGGECVVDKLLISNVHTQLISAICMTTKITQRRAIGVLEFYSVASAIMAADTAAKAADITLIEVRIGSAIGGKGYVTLTGEVDAVRAAVTAALRESSMLVGSTVIPKPSQKLLESLL